MEAKSLVRVPCAFCVAILLFFYPSCNHRDGSSKESSEENKTLTAIPAKGDNSSQEPGARDKPGTGSEQGSSEQAIEFGTSSAEQIAGRINDPNAFKSPEELGGFVAGYAEYLSSLVDSDLLVGHVAALRDGATKNQILQKIGRDSQALNPETLAALISAAKTPRAREELGFGVKNRIGALGSSDERIEAAQAYLDSSPPPEIGNLLVRAAVKELILSNPEGTAEWLLAQPAEISRAGESQLLSHFAKTDPEEGVGFIQDLYDSDMVDRADRAIRDFSTFYGITRPQEALEWSLKLPDDLGNRNSAIMLAIYELAKKDSQSAASYLDRIENEGARKQAASLIKKAEGAKK